MGDHHGSSFSRYEGQRSKHIDREDIHLHQRSRERDRDRGFYMGRDREREEKDENRRDQFYGGRNGHGGGLGSLIVRSGPPPDPEGSAHRKDYEAGGVENEHRHASSYYERRDRFSDAGYDKEGGKNPVPAGSSSPRRRIPDSYGRNLDHDGPHRGRGFRGGRHRGRFGDHHSPPFAPASMGRGTASFGRGFPGPDYRPAEPFPPEGESFKRNNPNIPPREGDWICSEPTCGNLNFARRTHCNNCNKPRRDMTPFHMGGGGGLQGGFRGTRPRPPFIGGPPMGRGMGRGTDGYGSPPGVWGRGGPRAVDQVSPPRLGEKLPDFRPGRDPRDRTEYHDHYDYREREKFERLPPVGRGFMMGYRDSKREDRFNDRRVDHDVRSDRRPPTPPPRSRWGRDSRERSRSPMRSASREYRRDSHPERLRDDRREGRRDKD